MTEVMIKTLVSITVDQKKWLDKECRNLSKMVRKMLEKCMTHDNPIRTE
jgi:hypothetical protein